MLMDKIKTNKSGLDSLSRAEGSSGTNDLVKGTFGTTDLVKGSLGTTTFVKQSFDNTALVKSSFDTTAVVKGSFSTTADRRRWVPSEQFQIYSSALLFGRSKMADLTF